MPAQPTQLERLGEDRLRITWSDGIVREYTVQELRDECTCATCREKRSAPPPPPTELHILSVEEARPVTVVGMKPVGSYGYKVEFSDGHNTGIYTFDQLRTLGTTC